MKKLSISLTLAFLLLVVTVGQVYSAPDRLYLRNHGRKIVALEKTDQTYAPGEVLVKFKDGVSARNMAAARRGAGLGVNISSVGPKQNRDIHVVKTGSGTSVAAAVSTLKRNRYVEYAEPNYIYKSNFTPNDPNFAKQWGLNNTGQEISGTTGTIGADIGAVDAWDIEQGFSTSVTVAVIDSGIDLDHPDLAGKLWTNAGEVPENDKDDDGNGYTDDVNGFNTAGISQGEYWVLEGFNPVRPFSGAEYEVAQSITGTGAYIRSAGFWMTREGSPTANMDLAIREDLDGADLATAVVQPDDTSESVVTRVLRPLSAPTFLEKGKTYYLVMSINDASATINDHYSVGEANYPDGAGDIYREGMQHWKIGSDWLSFPEYDFAFVTGNNAVPHDDNGHGTHVSGIIGAASDNGAGVAGVAPGVEIMPIKAGDSGGGFMLSDIMQALYYAADNGADVINMSFGGAMDSEMLDQLALNYADLQGCVLIAAAGNSGDGTLSYPAAYDNVLGVGATDNRDNRAFFSTFNSSVDFSAPGQDIYSTMPSYLTAMNSLDYNRDYSFMSGTSMASPMVAGAAAVIKAARPSLTPVAIEKILEKGVKDLGAPGRDDSFGYGRIDLYRSLRTFVLDTELVTDPPFESGDNGWFTSAPLVSLIPSLAPSNAFYSWDATPAVTTYTVPFAAPEGERTLYFYSRTSSQTETVKSEEIKVDSGLPTDLGSFAFGNHIPGSASSDKTIDAAFSGATDTVSGVEGYSYSWSEDSTALPEETVNFPSTGSGTETVSDSLADGIWWLNLRTKDFAGNWMSTVHYGPFEIDTVKPTGSIKINGGATYATTSAVTLNLSATDGGGSGVEKMRFKDEGGSWSGWIIYATTKARSLPGAQGTKRVYAEFRDAAGNISSAYSDTIFYDKTAPIVTVAAPTLATGVSKTKDFKVAWAATDSSLSGIKNYDVQYRLSGGSWTNWLMGTTAKSKIFDKGSAGKTYDFRARARDNAGNTGGWSAIDSTVVPYDNDALMSTRSGFSAVFSNSASQFYKGTVRSSVRGGESFTFKFTGKQFWLINTVGINRSKAKIFVDGVLVKTVDNYSITTKYRQAKYSKSWGSSGAHTVKIENLGTAGRRLYDIDAIGVLP